MTIKVVPNIDSKCIKRFFEFVKERHAIYIRRTRGDPWPWTDDLILQAYKFTNVFRELDTGTIWLRENILEPYADHPELLFNIALYRHYNYWPLAEEILGKFGMVDDINRGIEPFHDLIEFVRKYKIKYGRAFTGAHMINCMRGMDKIMYVFGVSAFDFWMNRHRLWKADDTLKSTFNRILSIIGYGPFLSYEVVTDLRHTKYLKDAGDIMTWANPGPGAQRGVLRLCDISNFKDSAHPPSVDISFCIDVMRHLLDKSVGYMPDWMPLLEMRDIEHSLCEWDKYERVRLGQGRPRSKYRPPIVWRQV